MEKHTIIIARLLSIYRERWFAPILRSILNNKINNMLYGRRYNTEVA